MGEKSPKPTRGEKYEYIPKTNKQTTNKNIKLEASFNIIRRGYKLGIPKPKKTKKQKKKKIEEKRRVCFKQLAAALTALGRQVRQAAEAQRGRLVALA